MPGDATRRMTRGSGDLLGFLKWISSAAAEYGEEPGKAAGHRMAEYLFQINLFRFFTLIGNRRPASGEDTGKAPLWWRVEVVLWEVTSFGAESLRRWDGG